MYKTFLNYYQFLIIFKYLQTFFSQDHKSLTIIDSVTSRDFNDLLLVYISLKTSSISSILYVKFRIFFLFFFYRIRYRSIYLLTEITIDFFQDL